MKKSAAGTVETFGAHPSPPHLKEAAPIDPQNVAKAVLEMHGLNSNR